jgi:hypothetical protein
MPEPMATDHGSEASELGKSSPCRASNNSFKHTDVVRVSQAHGGELEP